MNVHSFALQANLLTPLIDSEEYKAGLFYLRDIQKREMGFPVAPEQPAAEAI
jgi:hypothetical protein